MKKCYKCGIDKLEDDFSSNKSKPNGKNLECKQCQKEYFAKYYSNNPEKQKTAIKKCHQRGRYFIQKYKIEKGCSVCGYNKHPAALHFHHRDPRQKSFSVSMAAAHLSEQELIQEIIKCDILCANCHAEHHNKDFELKEPSKKKDTVRRIEPKDRKSKTAICPECGKYKSDHAKRCQECSYKDKESKIMPEKSILQELIWQIPSTKIAKMYDVSDKCVEKWCIKYLIEKPPRGYWTKRKKDPPAP